MQMYVYFQHGDSKFPQWHQTPQTRALMAYPTPHLFYYVINMSVKNEMKVAFNAQFRFLCVLMRQKKNPYGMVTTSCYTN